MSPQSRMLVLLLWQCLRCCRLDQIWKSISLSVQVRLRDMSWPSSIANPIILHETVLIFPFRTIICFTWPDKILVVFYDYFIIICSPYLLPGAFCKESQYTGKSFLETPSAHSIIISGTPLQNNLKVSCMEFVM